MIYNIQTSGDHWLSRKHSHVSQLLETEGKSNHDFYNVTLFHMAYVYIPMCTKLLADMSVFAGLPVIIRCVDLVIIDLRCCAT